MHNTADMKVTNGLSHFPQSFFNLPSLRHKDLAKKKKTRSINKNIKIGLLHGCFHTIKVSGGGSLPKPHECTVSRGEEWRRRRVGKEISGPRIQTWNDLTERAQVRLRGCFVSCSHEGNGFVLSCKTSNCVLCLPLQVSGGNSRISVQRRDGGGHSTSGRLYERIPEGAPVKQKKRGPSKRVPKSRRGL